jgi:superfamily II DNA or RNA helicase
MTTFAELRERFSDDEDKRGKQFERVCKWFLETDPRYSDRLVNVWLWDDWPGRWGTDCGIDLVAEDRDGKNWAIQAKCYAPDESVSKRDIDSFLSESTNENMHHRLLIATTNQVGKNARGVIHRQNKVIPVSQLLLHDLETAPVVWPSNPARPRGGGPRKPLKRWPHQTQAINNVTKNLGKRGQMISACGTGKTLAALWISERLEATRSLVLVPSLTLLSQTVSEWLANAKEPFAYLPVCSDETVSRGNDAAVMFTSDLEYPVTTDPDAITKFLRKRGRLVVFSTYQSSPQVAAAQAAGRVPGFDLVIADEAHRCAGRVSSGYGTVLDDEAIRARQRLFMTATPRTYTARVQKKADEADIEIASMDDENVFGPVVHQLNFGEAIEKGLLSDYRVVVVGIDDGRYKQMVDNRRIVKTDKDLETDAETLAKHVALIKAIRDYDLRRTITFHSRIKTANEFANMLPKVASWMKIHQRPKVDLVTDHVSGEMSTGERNRRLDRLRNIDPGQSFVLTNAQCLSEGIDVPTLEGVAFIDPRRSQVDIVQAVGRAIRLSEDKTLGTIVIPVFLRDTDDPEAALEASEFEPVWAIVRALRSHDDVFGQALDSIRTNLGGGRGGGLPPKIVLDLPEKVTTRFVEAVETLIVSKATEKWEFWFGSLLQFIEDHGHARPKYEHMTASGDTLGVWVSQQRTLSNQSLLRSDRKARLHALEGWVWDERDAKFEGLIQDLLAFVAIHDHARIPDRYVTEDGTRLGTKVYVLRRSRNQGRLPEERQRRLEAIHPTWSWGADEDVWNENFEAVEAYVAEHGDARVPSGYEPRPGFRVGRWVVKQRARRKRGELPEDRVARLVRLPGWVWDLKDSAWDDYFAILCAYVDQNGHARVPRNWVMPVSELGDLQIPALTGPGPANPEVIRLGEWVKSQRGDYSTGRIRKDRESLLGALPDWVWGVKAHRFEDQFAALEDHVAAEGHARVRADFVTDSGLRLGSWVTNQRTRYKRGTMSESELARFLSIPGWVWNKNEADFERSFAHLELFVRRTGHARVPQAYVDSDGVAVGSFVSNMRSEYGRRKMDPGRIARFESLSGWVWSVR